MSKKIIEASDAFAISHSAVLNEIFKSIEANARHGKMYYDVELASTTADIFDILKSHGYRLFPINDRMRISWRDASCSGVANNFKEKVK